MEGKCAANNKTGSPCRNRPKPGELYCGRHMSKKENVENTPVVKQAKEAAAASIAQIKQTIDEAPLPVTAVVTTEIEWKGVHLYNKVALQNLQSKKYKYTGIDLSPLALYILHPFWNAIQSMLPLWLAANLLTVAGGVSFTLAYISVFWNNPAFIGHHSRMVYLFCALMNFAYQTFDGIDGKQARATKSQSPLGEMLDHGVDSLWCMFGLMALAGGAQSGADYWLYALIILFTVLPFFIVQWESYHTHKLILGYVNGPTEGLLVVTIVFCYLAIGGANAEAFLASPISSWLPSLPLGNFVLSFVPGDLKTVHYFICFMGIGAIGQVVTSLYTVVVTLVKEKRPILPSLSLLTPAVIIGVSSALWVWFQPEVFANSPHLILMMIGFASSNLTVRVICGHLMNERPRLFHIPMLIVPAVAAYNYFGYPYATEVLWAGCVFNIVYHMIYMVMMVRDFCQFLHISFATVSRPKVQ